MDQNEINSAYKTLCLPKDKRSRLAVDRAYRELSKKYHPQILTNVNNPNPRLTENFIEVQTAHERLVNAYNNGDREVKEAWDLAESDAQKKKEQYERSLGKISDEEKMRLMKKYDDDIKAEISRIIEHKLNQKMKDEVKNTTGSKANASDSSHDIPSSSRSSTQSFGHSGNGSGDQYQNVRSSNDQGYTEGFNRRWTGTSGPSSEDTQNQYYRSSSQPYTVHPGYMSMEEARRLAGLDRKTPWEGNIQYSRSPPAKKEQNGQPASQPSKENPDLPTLHEASIVKTVKSKIIESIRKKTPLKQTRVNSYDLFSFSNKAVDSNSTLELLQVSSTSQNPSYMGFYGDKGYILILIRRGNAEKFITFIPRDKSVYAAVMFDPEVWALTYLTAEEAKEKKIKYGPSARISKEVGLSTIDTCKITKPQFARSSTEKHKLVRNYALPAVPDADSSISHFIDLRSDLELTFLQHPNNKDLTRIVTDPGDLIIMSNRHDNAKTVLCTSGREKMQRVACQYDNLIWAAAIIKAGDERNRQARETGEVSLKEEDFVSPLSFEEGFAEAKPSGSAQTGEGSAKAKDKEKSRPKPSGSTKGEKTEAHKKKTDSATLRPKKTHSNKPEDTAKSSRKR